MADSDGKLRLVGYGVALTPHAPWRVDRLPAGAGPRGGGILYEHQAGQLKHKVMVVPGAAAQAGEPIVRRQISDGDRTLWGYFAGDGGTRIILEPGLDRLDTIADLDVGPAEDRWEVETSIYRASWPEAFRLTSAGDTAVSLFDLRGPDDALIYIQGPFDAHATPSFESLVGDGQREVEQGLTGFARWLEVEYDHEGSVWRQRHYVVPFDAGETMIVTTQAPKPRVSEVRKAADVLVSSLRPADAVVH